MSKRLMSHWSRRATEHEDGGDRRNAVTRELVNDSRVLIEHARVLIDNSSARIERTKERLQRLVSAIEAAETANGAAGRVRLERLLRWLDRRDAA